MNTASIFEPAVDAIYLHLVLEDWTELPAEGTPEWEETVRFFRQQAESWGGRIREMRHNGLDLHLLLQLFRETAADAFVEALRRQLRHPYWRPFMDRERFAWLGHYRMESVRRGDKLAEESLERPTRRYKQNYFSHNLERTLPFLWHEAATPEAAGVELVAVVAYPPRNNGAHMELLYRESADHREAWAAAQMNARLRVGRHALLVDSTGWGSGRGLPGLVFNVPTGLLADPRELPETVEVWWETDERKPVAVVPCFPHGTEPKFLTAPAS